MIKVLLVDDHPSVGEGTKNRLEQEDDFSVTVVELGTDALQLIEDGAKFDIMLFDLNMPVINGLELTRRVLNINSDAMILIYTGYDIAPNFNILVETGVSGFISKASPLSHLVNSIRYALRGECVIPTNLLRQLRRRDMSVTDEKSGKTLELTSINEKEQCILQEVAKGKSNKEIAKILYMSQRNVEYNLTRIFEKLKVRSRSEAVIKARKHGLIHNSDFI
ncbi:response regulator transcription factor [Chengkuizengella axinellae]|uniref:Response regulator transcription factor n=1 Tax=Chengkuizengella axinellae TaxID=3064388 RepID=A0ABT9J0R1_9BACL|nr:response regulator transcription factor [Chengkuizengella sp. 2205SS18-9]MDP5274997.1 response regulator transcription factor [Chengkuizengella sp. 2205SS18-9]